MKGSPSPEGKRILASVEADMSLPHLIVLLKESNLKISYLQAEVEKTTEETMKLTILVHRLKQTLLCLRCRLVWDDPRMEEKRVCHSCEIILKTYV